MSVPAVLPQLLTMDQLADRLGVTHRHARRLVTDLSRNFNVGRAGLEPAAPRPPDMCQVLGLAWSPECGQVSPGAASAILRSAEAVLVGRVELR